MWICGIISSLRQTLHLQFLLFLDHLKYKFKTKHVSGKYTLKCIWNYCLAELQEPSLVALRHEDYIKFDNLLKIHLSLFMLAYLPFFMLAYCLPTYLYILCAYQSSSLDVYLSFFMLAYQSYFVPADLSFFMLAYLSSFMIAYQESFFMPAFQSSFFPVYLSFSHACDAKIIKNLDFYNFVTS